jgi:phage gpG-like protein
MPVFEALNFGDAKRVANKFVRSAAEAEPTYLRAALLEIARLMTLSERITFAQKGRRGGKGWPALKEDTIRKKYNERILYTSGSNPGYSSLGNDTLYKSVSQMNAPYQILNIFGYEMEFGTSRPEAQSHQFGAPSRNIPQREFLKFTGGDRQEWNTVLRRHLTQPWRQTSVPTRAAYRSLSGAEGIQLGNILSRYGSA